MVEVLLELYTTSGGGAKVAVVIVVVGGRGNVEVVLEVDVAGIKACRS